MPHEPGGECAKSPFGGGSRSVEHERETLVYAVDTGIGIPQHQVETIFIEFQQAESTITQEFGGTGLGLSITKKFVEMHGGRIWVEK